MISIPKLIKLTKGEHPIAIKSNKSKWIIHEKKFLNSKEIKIIRDFCREVKDIGIRKSNFRKIRSWYMVELGLMTGLRVTEMSQLQLRDILLDDEQLALHTTGKGNKFRSVKFSNEFKKITLQYLFYKDLLGFRTDPDSFLLNNKSDKKISKRSLQNDFKEIIIKAGLPSYHHIHNLRHTYATNLIKTSNRNYRLAQMQLGHSSIKTTQIYAGVLDEEVRDAVKNLYK